MSSVNLLPPHIRAERIYARRNTKLRKWCLAMLVGIAGIGVVVIVGLMYINQTRDSLERETEVARQELADQDLNGVQERVEGLSDSFKLVASVLSKQVLFSRLLTQAGAVMPAGAVMGNLTINELSGGIDLEVLTKDYQTATQVQVNLQDPENQLFERVDIVNIGCNAEEETPYPCTGAYRALFTADNPFTFLNQAGR